jgi:hypothetical protein
MECLIHAGLIGAERASTLKYEKDLPRSGHRIAVAVSIGSAYGDSGLDAAFHFNLRAMEHRHRLRHEADRADLLNSRPSDSITGHSRQFCNYRRDNQYWWSEHP